MKFVIPINSNLQPNPAWHALPLFDRTGWKRMAFGEFAESIGERAEPKDAQEEIYVGLKHLDPQCLHIRRWGKGSAQWVDGSFTDETRLDPDDIDLVNFVSATEINAIPAPDRPRATALLNGRNVTKTAYSCHTFLETTFPAGHLFEPIFERQRLYWRKWWSTPQDYSRPPVKTPAPHRGSKGIVVMTVGTPTAAPTINTNL